MTPQQLKNSILQMAMQGKLVEQRPEEGSGEELYQQIQKEKQKLIKEGKIKKEKPLPEITEDEIPFEIPESWKWVRLGDISSYDQPKMKISPSQIEPDMWSLDLEDIEKVTGKVITHTLAKNRKINGDKICFWKGNILYSKLRPYLMKILIADGDGITTPEVIPFNVYGCANQEFYLWFLRSPYVDTTVNSVSYGVKMPRVGTGAMVNLLVPIPPEREQRRIVAKIEELIPLIGRYTAAYDNLQSYTTRFPNDLKKSILQQAIQGKLVPQDPNDESASVLFEKITREKEKLIKEGKIKKQKLLPPIKDNEALFEIPESWRWVYIGDIFQHNTGKALNGACGRGKMLTYITTSNLYWNRFELDKLKEMPFTEAEIEKCTVKKNDLLVCEGGDFGRSAIWTNDKPMRIQNHIHRLRAYYAINIKFYYYIFLFYKNCGFISGKGIGIQGLSSNALHKLVVPLPPLPEQIRIVEKIEKFLSIVDRYTTKYDKL